MKAAYFEQHGGPEVIRYGDLLDPEAGPGEIVVDVRAASVNGTDCVFQHWEVGPRRQCISIEFGLLSGIWRESHWNI